MNVLWCVFRGGTGAFWNGGSSHRSQRETVSFRQPFVFPSQRVSLLMCIWFGSSRWQMKLDLFLSPCWRGHRVLLFSQMTRMLDIVQDYMEYKGRAFKKFQRYFCTSHKAASTTFSIYNNFVSKPMISKYTINFLTRLTCLLLCLSFRLQLWTPGWVHSWRGKKSSSFKLQQQWHLCISAQH